MINYCQVSIPGTGELYMHTVAVMCMNKTGIFNKSLQLNQLIVLVFFLKIFFINQCKKETLFVKNYLSRFVFKLTKLEWILDVQICLEQVFTEVILKKIYTNFAT